MESIPSAPGIYAIVNQTNQHRYVGSAKNLLKRQQHHLRDLATGKHKNPHLQRAYDLYGTDAFSFVVLECVEHESDLLTREQFYIDTLNPEYNIARTAGSNLGRTYTPETRTRMSAAAQTRANMLEQMRKLNADRTGKPLSPSHRAKISAIQVGKQLPEAHKANISAAHKGQKKSKAHAANISKGKMGHETTQATRDKIAASKRGTKASPETRARMSATRLGKKRPGVGAKVSATKQAKKLARNADQPPLL